MRHLIIYMISLWLIVVSITGCSKYRSKSQPEEVPYVEYSSDDFRDIPDCDAPNTYNFKVIHINL